MSASPTSSPDVLSKCGPQEERAVRVLSSDPNDEVAKRFELDARRVNLLPAGVLMLEKLS